MARNAWRDSVHAAWQAATDAWLLARESEAIGYATEMAQFEQDNPRPRFKDFLIAMKGSAS